MMYNSVRKSDKDSTDTIGNGCFKTAKMPHHANLR